MARPRKKIKTRGMREPEELPSGRYRGWTWNAATQRKGPSKTFSTFTEADAWMRAEQARIDGHYAEAGVPVARNRRRRAFAEYALHWAQTSSGVEPTTRQARICHARELGRQWPQLMVDEIDRATVKAYMAAMEAAGLAPGTQRNRLAAMRNIFGEAILDGLRADDPTRTIENPTRATLRVHRVLTDDEFDRVLEATPVWLRPALLLSHDAGLRISEVAGLRWQRLDLLHGRVMVADVVLLDGLSRAYPKGKRVLPVPLTERTLAALRAHQERHTGGPGERVFREPGRGAEMVTPARLRNLWEAAVARAGIAAPLPRFHDLRHGCGHALREAGAPIDVIQAVLRHQNITTSRIYMPDVSDAEARQWLDRTQRRTG